jgi:aminoglycoside phosphotransferase
MFVVELAVKFFAQGEQLFALEVGNRHTLPRAACPLKRRLHEFQHGALAERMRDGFAAPAFFQKQPFE